MQLVILAGGKGTRLGLADRPKPMVEINKKPLLEHQILLAKEYGIKEIFILSSYKAEIITSYFKDGKKFGIKIHHIIEETPLGTAGALKTIEEKLEDRFLVFYGDIYMDFDIKSFIEFDKQHDSVGTLLLHPNDHPEDSDLVEIDKKNIVKNLILKPHNDIYYTNLVNAAVFIFSKKIFNYINKNTFCQIEKDIIPTLLENNETIIEIKTTVVEMQSFKLSALVAISVLELIKLPYFLLKKLCHNFNKIAKANTPIVIYAMLFSYTTTSNVINLLIEDSSNKSPIAIIINETINPVIYSILSCPKGCSLSQGLADNLNPTKVRIELPASAKLLIPSAIIAILLIIKPIIIFKAHIIILLIIPTMPHIVPYAFLTFEFSIFL